MFIVPHMVELASPTLELLRNEVTCLMEDQMWARIDKLTWKILASQTFRMPWFATDALCKGLVRMALYLAGLTLLRGKMMWHFQPMPCKNIPSYRRPMLIWVV
jgi:hypothetical protein